MSKHVCTDDKILIYGSDGRAVDVSDYVSGVDTHHHVGELVSCTVTFQAVRVESEVTVEDDPVVIPAENGSYGGTVYGRQVRRQRHIFHIAED